MGRPTRAPNMKLAARAKEPCIAPLTFRVGYWVNFIDDYSRFPAVYFVRRKSDVVSVFNRYGAWAENAVRGCYVTTKGVNISPAVISCEHSIRDTPHAAAGGDGTGVMTLLALSSLSRSWREDPILPLTTPFAPCTHHELFYGEKGSVDRLRPFGCLTYVQCRAPSLRYPSSYKGWAPRNHFR